MEIEQVKEILNELGITFKNKKILVDGAETKDTIVNKLLSTKGTSLDEIRKVMEESAKKPVELPDDLRFKDKLTNMEVISPAFSTDNKWNKADERIFSFFSLAKTSVGGGLLLLIHNKGTEYTAVQLSNSALSNLADITSACSHMHYVDPDTGVKRTLYDHILHEFDKIMKEALSVYRKSNAIEFGTWAVKSGIPTMMLNNYKLMSVQEEKDIDNEAGGKTTMYRAHSLFFNENPMQCLANHYDTLAGVPSRIARMPKLFSNDMDEPALYHIDLDTIIDRDNPHPTWDKYMRRYPADQAEVLEAFIWSIFDSKNTGRQLGYIYDPHGLGGKTVLQNAIAHGLGEVLVAAVQKDSLNNQFAMSKIWNKRLVVIDDNKNPNLVRSEKMHMILGSGLADVEEKGKKSFTFRMQCKVLANGNVKLNIDPDANHERTRVIVFTPKMTDEMLKEIAVCDDEGNVVRDRKGRPKFIGDNSFEESLKNEFRSFLGVCKEAYDKLCPKRSSIMISDDMDEILDNMSEDLYDVLDEKLLARFEFGDRGASMTVGEFTKNVNSVLRDMEITLGKSADNLVYDNVVQHIMKKYGVYKGSCRVGKNVFKGYKGVRATSPIPASGSVRVTNTQDVDELPEAGFDSLELF